MLGTETHVSFEPGSKLNIAKAGEAKNEFARIVRGENGRLVLDLANLDYIDSSGVGALLSLLRLCKERQWTLTLTNPQQPVKDLFNLLQLQSIFNLQ